jgi:hypothetical protein
MPTDSIGKPAVAWKSLRLERFLRGKWRSKVSETAAWVYLGYLTHAANDEAGIAYPGAKTIAGLLEIRVDTVKKARRELIAAGLLTAVNSSPGRIGSFRVEIPPADPEPSGGVAHPHTGGVAHPQWAAISPEGGGVEMPTGGGVERRLESIIQSDDESGAPLVADLLRRGGMEPDDAIQNDPHFTVERLRIAVENAEAAGNAIKSKSGYVCDQIRRGDVRLSRRAVDARRRHKNENGAPRPRVNGEGAKVAAEKTVTPADIPQLQGWASRMKAELMGAAVQ